MAVLTSFSASLIDENGVKVLDLPDLVIGIAENFGSIPTSQNVTITDDYDYIVNDLDDGVILGGGVYTGYESNLSYLEELSLYIPLIRPKAVIPLQYFSGSYRMKIVNESGYYGVSQLLSLLENTNDAAHFSGYDAQGNLIASNIPLCYINAREDFIFGMVPILNGPIDSATDFEYLNVTLRRTDGRTRVRRATSTGGEDKVAWLRGLHTYAPSRQVPVTVSWARPGDGKILTDDYVISVTQVPSESSGGSGEGGGGGGHSF